MENLLFLVLKCAVGALGDLFELVDFSFELLVLSSQLFVVDEEDFFKVSTLG